MGFCIFYYNVNEDCMSIRKAIVLVVSIIFLTSCWFSPQDKTRYLVAFNPSPDIHLLDPSHSFWMTEKGMLENVGVLLTL